MGFTFARATLIDPKSKATPRGGASLQGSAPFTTLPTKLLASVARLLGDLERD